MTRGIRALQRASIVKEVVFVRVVVLLVLFIVGWDCDVAPLKALHVTGPFVWGEDCVD
jgi:hypothetical protein